MNDLLIGLLSALVATNPPAAVSNLVQKKTGIAVAIADPNDPVEREYRKLLEADEAAQQEVEKWAKEKQGAGGAANQAELAAYRAKVQRRYEPVKKAYEDFLQVHTNHVNARVAYASFLGEIGEEEASAAQLEKARALDPADPAVWNNLANHYGHNGDVKRAFEYYAKAIELEPATSLYYQNLATTVFLFRKDAMEFYQTDEQGVFGKSLGLYRKALELDPQNFLLATEVAQTYYGVKTPMTDDPDANRRAEAALAEQALAAWQVAQKLAGDDLQREGVYLHFARWQINTGRFDEARRSLLAVTNQAFAGTKRTLTKKLAEREAASLTNAPAPAK